METDSIPTVRFIYATEDGTDIQEFVGRCHFLPRLGDAVEINEQQVRGVVKEVFHGFTPEHQTTVRLELIPGAFVPPPRVRDSHDP